MDFSPLIGCEAIIVHSLSVLHIYIDWSMSQKSERSKLLGFNHMDILEFSGFFVQEYLQVGGCRKQNNHCHRYHA